MRIVDVSEGSSEVVRVVVRVVGCSEGSSEDSRR